MSLADARAVDEATPASRGAMWQAFHPEAMAMLSRYEGALAKDSHVQAPAPLPVKAPNITPRLPPHERILALVDRAGGRGMMRGEIKERFPKPRPMADQLMAWLGELEESGLLRSEAMKMTSFGNPGVRYFHFNHQSPRTVDGMAVFD